MPMLSKGIIYILVATLSFAVMNVMAKDISNLPAFYFYLPLHAL